MHYLIRCKSAVLTGAEKIGSVSGRDVGSPAWGVLSGFPGLAERVFK